MNYSHTINSTERYNNHSGPFRLKINPDGYLDYSEFELSYDICLPYNFEILDWKYWAVWVHSHWSWCLYAGALYILTIFGIQAYMKNRDAFNLKRELFLWNSALGIFSLAGFTRVAPEFIALLSEEGFFKTVCVWQGSMPTAFWTVLFVFSKFVELGDTIFIVLRKRKLQVLQWYHHIATLAVCWLTGPYVEPIGRYYVVMNYGVHSLMYPYFALRALNLKLPRYIANLITTLQLTQMLVALCVNTYSGMKYYLHGPESCYRHPNSIKMFFLVYGSFTILFGQLFYDLVLKKNEKGRRVKAE